MQWIQFIRKIVSGSYVIEGSGQFDGTSGYHQRTIGAGGNGETFTIFGVFKLADLDQLQVIVGSETANADQFSVAIGSSNNIVLTYTDRSNTAKIAWTSTQVLRDTNAYYFFAITVDTSVATPVFKFWLNDDEVTAWTKTTNSLAQNDTTSWNYNATDTVANIGCRRRVGSTATEFFGGYIAMLGHLDGTVITDPETAGIIEVSGAAITLLDVTSLSYGTEGWLFVGGTDMAAGTDSSGNGNNFTKTGTITATNDSPTDKATSGYGNYAVWNPLVTVDGGTYSNGNLDYVTGNSEYAYVTATIGVTSGVWYWEVEKDAGGVESQIGVTNRVFPTGTTDLLGSTAGDVCYRGSDTGYVRSDNSSVSTGDGAIANGDIVGVRLDLDAGTPTIKFYKNDTLLYSHNLTANQDPAQTGLPLFPAIGDADLANTTTFKADFGQLGFTYSLPTGHKQLCTANLPAPAVPNYEDEYYIEAGISHTNGATTAVTLPKTVSGGAMARIKRTDSTGAWYVVDTVRGANKFVTWETGAAEDTSTWTDQNLSGTTLTLPSALATGTYLIEVFYVGSYFQMGTWTASSSTQTITYDTALDSELGLLVNFNRNAAGAGVVYHKDLATGKVMFTDNTSAETTRSDYSSDPDNVNFDVVAGGTSPDFVTGRTFVYWAWANSGPYAFGSYTGNLNANGPVVYIGGSPASFMTKRNEAAWNWAFHAQALGANENYQYLIPNATNAINATTTVNEVDFSATGYKVRDGDNNNINGSGIEHLYMAFGITPIGGSGISQGRAR
jgi:hypothetical protein